MIIVQFPKWKTELVQSYPDKGNFEETLYFNNRTTKASASQKSTPGLPETKTKNCTSTACGGHRYIHTQSHTKIFIQTPTKRHRHPLRLVELLEYKNGHG